MDYPYSHTVALGGLALRLKLHFEEAAAFFAPWVSGDAPVCEVAVSDSEFSYVRERMGVAFDAHSEASILTASCSDALLPFDRCLIHAVALRFRDQAWLIAAPSGVGKSTQARVLQELWPGEFSVICGDRPVLQLTADGDVMVYPSPWNGKENWYGAAAAPLAGIVFLQRGDYDDAYEIKRRDAVIPCLQAMIHSGVSEDIIRRVASFTDQLLRRVPVYRLQSENVPGSTKLLYEEIIRREDFL